MLLFIHITGLCLKIITILVICFQLLTTLDSQLLKINLHKHNISFAQLIRFARMLTLRGHRALFVTLLSVPMGMTSPPSADDDGLGLWPGGEEEGDSTEGDSSLRKTVFLCIHFFCIA